MAWKKQTKTAHSNDRLIKPWYVSGWLKKGMSHLLLMWTTPEHSTLCVLELCERKISLQIQQGWMTLALGKFSAGLEPLVCYVLTGHFLQSLLSSRECGKENFPSLCPSVLYSNLSDFISLHLTDPAVTTNCHVTLPPCHDLGKCLFSASL